MKDLIKIIKEEVGEYLNKGIVAFHGSNVKIDKFRDMPTVNRRGNVAGYYFTTNKEIASSYGAEITEVRLLINKSFILGKSEVSDDMVETYSKELHKENPHLPIVGDWIRDKANYFLIKRSMPYTGLSGEAQQLVFKSGGYDSVIDGHEICVFNSDDIVVIKEVNETINNSNEYIYHGTGRGQALNIQRDGYMMPNNTGEVLPSISFTNDLDYAKYYAKSKGGSKMIILRTILTNDFKISDRILNNKGDEYVTFKPVVSSALEVLTNRDGWQPLDSWNVIFDEPL